MTTKGLKNVLTMDRVEFGEAWINAKETRLPDFLVAVRDAAVAAVRAEYEARTPTLDEATIARTIRSSVRVLGLYGTDAELLEAMPNSAACVRAGFALASRGGEREAAREAAMKVVREWVGPADRQSAEADVNRMYPAPQEARRVTLACGDVVTWERGRFVRYMREHQGPSSGDRVGGYEMWQDALRDTDTLADQSAVERLAKEAGRA